MNAPTMTNGENAQVDARFLIHADFSEGLGGDPTWSPNPADPIWIKGADGEVDSMTYEEFRSHSRVLLASRPLPDGRVT